MTHITRARLHATTAAVTIGGLIVAMGAPVKWF